jgi:diaminopropionate ammonia-lyase
MSVFETKRQGPVGAVVKLDQRHYQGSCQIQRKGKNMPVETINNPLRGAGLASFEGLAQGGVETDATAAQALYRLCPVKSVTPLEPKDDLARQIGVAEIWLKLENWRMGLGSFKALGAAYAIAKAAAVRVDCNDPAAMTQALVGETYICASAGNHGLSMAAGARLFGAKAVVLLSKTVPESFAERLRGKGAQVMRAGGGYEESVELSKQMAREEGWNLLSDGSWLGYADPARDVMEGYLIMGHEVVDQIERPPTHVFLQAGVGGLAAACAAVVRTCWGEGVTIIVVEPQAAPALMESIRAGRCVDTTGPVSSMGRLDCKTPSHLALKYLAVEADYFLTIGDQLVENAVDELNRHGVESSPSGAAGYAALANVSVPGEMGLDQSSRVVCFISEGPA